MDQETTTNAHEFNYLKSAAELFNSGQFPAAAAALFRAVELCPDRASTHYYLGNALLSSSRPNEAVNAYLRALELRGDFPQAWNHLGKALYELGRLEESVDALRIALKLEPESARICNDLAVALKDAGRTAEALSLFDRSIRLYPQRGGAALALTNKAVLLVETGDFEGARCAADEALDIDPDAVMAWHLRVALKTVAPEDPDLASLESLLERADVLGMTPTNRSRLRFALSKAWLDAGDTDRAFTHLEQANQLKRATFVYDSAATTARMACIAKTFTPELLQLFSGRAGHPTDVPVFVIGMPRSGTSLVEQILASHPAVYGAGELALLGKVVPGAELAEPYHCPPVYPELLAGMDPESLTRLGREYESLLRQVCPDKARVVDKLPANFLFAGLIHLILPNARIIHCRRDTLDTCLSCYMATFSGDVMFAYDQRELGDYYRHYRMLTDHWRGVLPSTCYTEVHYEAVVGNLEQEARRLVEFCGLPWDEQCLRFHQTRRRVCTSSAVGVRKPIYRNSVGRSRDYARHLRPLMDALAS